MKITVLFVLLMASIELIIGLSGILSSVRYFHNTFDEAVSNVFNSDTKELLTDAATAVSVSETETELVMNESGPDNIKKIADIVNVHANELGLDRSAIFCVLDSAGTVEYSSCGSDVIESSPVIDAALAGEENRNTAVTHRYIDYALPLKSGDNVRYVVYIKDTLSTQKAVSDRLIKNLITELLFSLIAAYIAATILASAMTRPIKKITKQTMQLADGEITSLPESEREDEIGELSNALFYLSELRREHADKTTSEKIKLEKILQSMSDGIMAFDMKGKLIHINPEAKRLLNRKFVDDIMFNTFFKEINLDDVTLEAMQYMPTDDFEREVHINGQMLQFNFTVYSRDSSEGGIIVIVHDVTKHERLESARRDFVANVSHELRTPLTVIKSYADILADTPDAKPEIRTRFLDTISSETDRMTKIISDLLTLSKLDENANYTRPVDDIDIRAMLEGLVERLSLTAKKKNQSLTYTPINDVPKIPGDRDGLERAISNIIINALKYTPSGGEIHVFSSNVYNDILIKVSDNGIGIPKEQIPHIFDRFYRVDKARSRDKGGTGLGLAIAKETVESAFHGKITITSDLNKGTDVTVSIPTQKK
ncbi:MAG: ATP-binding protein [Clostridiales bacterium]|nr:ATP-binding protein [Clostridiales bacterium]